MRGAKVGSCLGPTLSLTAHWAVMRIAFLSALCHGCGFEKLSFDSGSGSRKVQVAEKREQDKNSDVCVYLYFA